MCVAQKTPGGGGGGVCVAQKTPARAVVVVVLPVSQYDVALARNDTAEKSKKREGRTRCRP